MGVSIMGVARIIFGGGNTFRKVFKKFRKKISKNALFYHMKFWENFWKFSKNFLRKLGKMHYFSIFFKSVAMHALIFCAIGRQVLGKLLEIMRKFSKGLRIFLKKIAKNALFLHILGKDLAIHALAFCVWTKNKI